MYIHIEMRRTEPNAILAINSTDRYTVGQLAAPIAAPLYFFYNVPTTVGPPFSGIEPVLPANNFTLQYPNALIYGYIKSIIISQVQIDYHIPTIQFERNDILILSYSINNGASYDTVQIQLPFGFFTPDEIAAMLQIEIRNYTPMPNLTVVYNNATHGNGFIISTNNIAFGIRFPSSSQIVTGGGANILVNALRTYRMLGVIPTTIGYPDIITASPNFLYTNYIDICSANLTKFQKVKDSDTSATKRNNMIARIYLSGNSAPQYTTEINALGCEPFLFTADLNSPKVVRWSPDEAIYDLDFQLYDMYGELLFWDRTYPTEFMITALCIEGED